MVIMMELVVVVVVIVVFKVGRIWIAVKSLVWFVISRASCDVY